MTDVSSIKAVYFVGAGGIGMSAIARYFLSKGILVAGYDKTPSALTTQLEKEGMAIHYDDNVNAVPKGCLDKNNTHQQYLKATKNCHISRRTDSE